jgi:hypothetical protein
MMQSVHPISEVVHVVDCIAKDVLDHESLIVSRFKFAKPARLKGSFVNMQRWQRLRGKPQFHLRIWALTSLLFPL